MSDPLWGEPIFSYSRKQAIADGVLVDVSEMAREAGFKYPVAVTPGSGTSRSCRMKQGGNWARASKAGWGTCWSYFTSPSRRELMAAKFGSR